MCGLSGYFNFGRKPEDNNHVIISMLQLLEHRGPDDAGIVAVNTRKQHIAAISPHRPVMLEVSADLMLGFRRLSILDLSPNGHQPMCSPDEQVVLLMNGEIYNAFEYRENLQKEGFFFNSKTDTEVVLNLYLKHGFEQMVRMLNGMFGIALYDLRLGKLFLTRDRFGIKPLYLLREEGRIAFASEMKAFKALPGFRFELDEEQLDEFLLFRNLIHNTLFRNIVNLTPGTYYIINNYGEISEKCYYRLKEEQNSTIEKKEALDLLDTQLKQAVQRQLMSDVKLGCQLSGGVDSSLVSHYAAKEVSNGQLETVSIIFNEPGFSEETYIDYATAKLQLHAHKFTLDASYYLEHLESTTWHFEQPLNHPNTIGIYLLSEEARKHVTVLLSGEGADEALAGYSRFAALSESTWLSRRFLSKLKLNRKAIMPFLRYYADPYNRMIMASAFGNPSSARLLKTDFNFERAIAQRRSLVAGLQPNCLRDYRQFELLTYLPDLLMRQDKMSMAHSIENRVPFLDNDLITQAMRLPSESLLGKQKGRLETKLALKQLCAVHFQTDFAFRPKMGFGIPLQVFMNNVLFKEKLNEQLLPGLKERGIFQASFVEKAAQNIKHATIPQLETLWLMSGFESWAQQYLDQ